jgi:hypothetical protein
MASAATHLCPARLTVAIRTTTLALVVAAIALTACSQTGFSLPDRRTASTQYFRGSTPLAVGPLLSELAIPVPTTDPITATTIVAVLPESTSTPVTELDPVLPRLDIDPIFDAIHDRLANVITVPVRLPYELGESAATLTPTLSMIDTGGYVIHLGVGPDCNGASQCRVSTFTARRSVRSNPRVTSTGTEVPLPGGLVGMFSDATCGTDCNNGFVTWVEDHVLYSVGSRLASGPEVLRLAWLSIDPSVAPPVGPEICGPGAPAHNGRVARSITTELDDERTMHWLAVCSADGTDVEILRSEGELRWIDVDADGFYDAVVRHDDGTSTVFALDGNSPKAAIDVATSGRLVVGELGCWDSDGDGRHEAFDVASGDSLRFINPVTVRRTPANDAVLGQVGGC